MKFAVNVDDEGKQEFLNKDREDLDKSVKEMSRPSLREHTSMKYLLEYVYSIFSVLRNREMSLHNYLRYVKCNV